MGTCGILLPVKNARQKTNFDCGPAALRAICRFFDVGPHLHSIYVKKCETKPSEGTQYEKLIEVAREYGLKTRVETNLTPRKLKNCLDKGMPVICAIQHVSDDFKGDPCKKRIWGHYVVVVGYDSCTQTFQLRDPTSRHLRNIDFFRFISVWCDQTQSGENVDRLGIIFRR